MRGARGRDGAVHQRAGRAGARLLGGCLRQLRQLHPLGVAAARGLAARADLLRFVCDAAPATQGKFMPGSHIPDLLPSALRIHKPDFVLILPWNVADGVSAQRGYVHEWCAQYVVAVAQLAVTLGNHRTDG